MDSAVATAALDFWLEAASFLGSLAPRGLLGEMLLELELDAASHGDARTLVLDEPGSSGRGRRQRQGYGLGALVVGSGCYDRERTRRERMLTVSCA